MAVGADPLKASTLVTDSVRAIVDAMKTTGVPRYLGVTGTAEMPKKTLLGRLSTRVLRLTPVGHAARDHDAAYAIVVESGLTFTLAGCPYINDGPRRGHYSAERTNLMNFDGTKLRQLKSFPPPRSAT